MEKKEKKLKIQFVIMLLIGGFLILYCVDSISYAIQMQGYNQCIGMMAQGQSISNGLTNVGKGIYLATPGKIVSPLIPDVTSGTCTIPSRIFGE